MSKYSKVLLILFLPVLFCFGWCQNSKPIKDRNTATIKRKDYLFPYHTIIRTLPRDCADSRTDQSLYWLNTAQEKMLLPISIPQQEEEEVGEEVYSCVKQNTTFVEGEQLNRVKAIFNKMLPFVTRKLDFQIYVIDVPFENAFACPGGRMYVTLPLLKNMNDNQVANIIGHEICHLEQKHCNVHLKYRKLMGTPLSNILDILTQGLGHDPAVSVEAFKRWSVTDKPSFGNKVFRSHPYFKERVNCIEAYLKQAAKNAEGLHKIAN
jgi:beta-barrel assembly-enhancing protease